MSAWFWFLGGVLVGGGAAWFARPLWGVVARVRGRWLWACAVVAGGAATFAVTAAILYFAIGAPHAVTERTVSVPAAADSQPDLESRVAAEPTDARAWLELATLHRRHHDYVKARDAFSKVIQLNAMTADAWADYADALASMPGASLSGDARVAIERALSLDPSHPKALWLEASRAHEERRYADAVGLWKRLRAVLPADSSDIRLVDANIEEATKLAAAVPGTSADVVSGSAVPVEVSGTVSIDARFAQRVGGNATVFIYAKAADSPGPPLAVMRTTAGTWPISFRLDDSMAMMPARKLSQFEKIIVEARISRSGQATPGPGDLYVTSAVLRPADGKRLDLVINREIG